MARSLSRSELTAQQAQSPFPYASYRTWMDDDDEQIDPPIYLLSSEAMTIRPRTEWNTLGREVYDRTRLEWHVRQVIAALDQIVPAAGRRLLVRHEGRPRSWLFDSNAATKLRPAQLALLQSAAGVPLEGYSGGFLIENELALWLSELADYPYLLKQRDVEFICMDVPLLICAQHHLAIQLYSDDTTLLDRIEHELMNAGVRAVRAASNTG